jgi:4-hydroxybenzoate polyprenyltransferase
MQVTLLIPIKSSLSINRAAALMVPLKFFVYSNLFIAACAVLMVNQSYQLLIHTTPDLYFLAFVFFSTICSYSFHWYLSYSALLTTSRAKWLQRNQKLHIIFFIAGFSGSAVFFFYLITYWPWLLLGAVITFLYSAPKIPNRYFRILRKVAIGKTIFLAFVWMYVTSILPIVISGQAWRPDFYLFIISRFSLIYAICILFDYRDREDDKSKGIRSLITYLSEKGIRNLFVLSLVLFFVASLGMLFYQYSLLTVFLLLIPGIIVAALYNYARKNFSDMFYYFVLDGLMALSAMLTLLIRI